MKQSTLFILCGALALVSLAVGIIGVIHEKCEDKKHKPAATLRDLYDDNAASEPLFPYSAEAEYVAFLDEHYWGLGDGLS